MMVLSEKCKECNCICFAKYFQQNFHSWTSDNDDIDKLIQNTQLSTHRYLGKALEWIPYDKFDNIKYIADGKYKANWIDGNIIDWNISIQNWKRDGQNMNVELESINNPKNISLELTDKV
jgi:hypothetical protein